MAAAGITGGIMAAAGAGKKETKPQPLPMPEAPKIEDAAAKAEASARAKRAAMGRSQSIYTSPLGIGGEANIARKTLLGQ
jgi:hypothetical protein